MTAIKINNLNVIAKNVSLLQNITCSIPKNTITVIMGPSGCGKTTLLRSLNRLTDIDGLSVSGDIFVNNINTLSLTGNSLCDMRKKMGLLLQRPYTLPMSIYGNIEYAIKMRGLKKIKENVEKYLKVVNLWDEVSSRLNDDPSTLSIGQQQRLCLARGLAINPEIILADEPTSALDPISTQAIEKTFIELKSDCTIILVSHILRQVKRIADYVLFMYMGKLIESGPASDIFSNPKHEITKKYLDGSFY